MITTTVDDPNEFKSTKKTLFAGKKSMLIQLNLDDLRIASKFELIEHFYIKCDTVLSKFQILYTFVKFQLLEGKTLIFVT